MTEGKIEHSHFSLQRRILLGNGYFFVEHRNHSRYHESLGNLTAVDISFGHGSRIVKQCGKIKRGTIEQRRRQHISAAA